MPQEFPEDPAQRALLTGVLQALMASLDAKDSYTKGHSERVAHLARLIGLKLGLTELELQKLVLAGLVHDLGKIGVPEQILRKTERLTDAEYDMVKLHPEIGRKIVNEIPLLFQVIPAVLHHHERWDGRGYPSGLQNDSIPLFARILAVADSFDAMSSTRCYQTSKSQDQVLIEMRKCQGSQFDPEVTQALLEADLTTYEQLLERHIAGKNAA